MLKILPPTLSSDWKLRNDRIGYFRSYLVLNSFYYLSHENILNLNHSTEAVAAPYEHAISTQERKRVQMLFIKYKNSEDALGALEHFHKAYLPEHIKDFEKSSTVNTSNYYQIEDGWLGYKLLGTCIAILFGCPDQESASMFLNKIESNLSNIGG